MKTIAVANQKGGVGKTTLSAHLVYRALERGLRVLAVDMEKQGSLSLTFPPDEGGYLRASALFDPAPPALSPQEIDVGLAPTARRLSIIRADDALLTVDKADNRVLYNPGKALFQFSAQFDLCVIDTPPLLGIRLMGALSAADYVVTPLNIGLYELMGFSDLLETIHVIRTQGFNPRLQHVGIQIMKNNSDSSEDAQAVAALREQYGDAILPYTLPQRQSVMQAIAQKRPVWEVPSANTRRAAQEGDKPKPTIAESWLEAMDTILRRTLK